MTARRSRNPVTLPQPCGVGAATDVAAGAGDRAGDDDGRQQLHRLPGIEPEGEPGGRRNEVHGDDGADAHAEGADGAADRDVVARDAAYDDGADGDGYRRAGHGARHADRDGDRHGNTDDADGGDERRRRQLHLGAQPLEIEPEVELDDLDALRAGHRIRVAADDGRQRGVRRQRWVASEDWRRALTAPELVLRSQGTIR